MGWVAVVAGASVKLPARDATVIEASAAAVPVLMQEYFAATESELTSMRPMGLSLRATTRGFHLRTQAGLLLAGQVCLVSSLEFLHV